MLVRQILNSLFIEVDDLLSDEEQEQLGQWSDEQDEFVNIILAPKLEMCFKNRGNREFDECDTDRIRKMYEEGYHNRNFADLIIDNSTQTIKETVDVILMFLNK